MTFSALDRATTGPLFASDAMRAVFAERARIADRLRVEAALARAQATLGLAPAGLAAAIEAVSPDAFDLDAIGRETALAGVPSIPFLKALRALLPADVAGDLHKGATTQDLIDTADALAFERAFGLLAAECEAVLAGFAAMARRYARTPCAGRTYGQHATPVTFGFKAAVWAVGIADAAADLPGVRAGLCVASLGGPAGTLPAFGARAPAVADAFAAEIGLPSAPIAGHTRRAGIARAGTFLATLVGTLAKAAGDIAHLASTEVGELAEPHLPGRGGSSAMPHKRNPVSCTVILAAASAARGLVGPLLEGVGAAAHERPAGAWHAEWHALPQLFGLASGALREARVLAEGLVVDEAAMARNLDATRGLLFADAAAAALAPLLGREEATARVGAAADAVRARGIGLREALAECGDVPADALERAFDLTPAIEAAAAFVPRAVARVQAVRGALAAVRPAADLAALAVRTAEIYERNAARFDAERAKGLHEREWLDRFLALVRPDGRVLDLGCGTGDPIAAHIMETGRPVTGLDVAEAMLAIARARMPDGDWRHGDMRTLALAERFAGILAWNSLFHLTADEQRAALPRIAVHLEPGGALMATVGPRAGSAVGRVGADAVFHDSLSPEDYRDILERHGMTLVAFVAEDPACAGQTVLLARKTEGAR